ncbi:imidazole glycerol phosphate synthase subunit HisH [Candidatus Pelagibacter sp.]|jgi:imidazole glycerol-phosphate synthase subunit HisH|nr:imidazole glycerol phosphate synthase subunit HisH [Candidatus Pelagibacter sp.]
MKTIILNLGINNIKSIKNASEKICDTKVINDKSEFIDCDKIILPGNGSFQKGMEEIMKRGFDKIIKDFFKRKKKIIGICLGLQLMMKKSEESINTNGLGLIDGNVFKINNPNLRLPLLGWYDVDFKNNMFQNKSYFFNNNYVVDVKDKNLLFGKLDNLSAFIKKDNFYGFQFHPEKSGKHGIEILKKTIYS